MTTDEFRAARAVAIATATAHDATLALRRAGVHDGQLLLVQAAASILEAAQDHPACADVSTGTVGMELVAYMLGHAATTDRP